MSTARQERLQPTASRGSGIPHSASALKMRREQFIPLRKADLVETLAGTTDLSDGESRQLRRFCRLLDVLLHCEYQAALEELKNGYAPFDPDADTRAGAELSPEQLDVAQTKLFDKFGWLLARGNFVRLAQEEINQSLSDRSQWGLNLNLNFEIFERLEVYCRGDVLGTRFLRRLRKGFRSESVDVPIYQRLVVIFRLQPDRKFSQFLDTQDIHIKLFKDIPKADLDMLLPGTQVKMSLLDRAKILLPSLSGLVIGVGKLALALSLTPLMVWGVVGGTVGYSARSVYGYLNTRQKYQLNLTQSLYFQNLDNNAGAVHRLLDEAEEQENRETLLAYYFLWREAQPAGLTSVELDRRIEAFLRQHAAREIDFEIGDSLDKLARLQIAERDSQDRWKAAPIEEAIAALTRHWSAIPG